MKFVSRFRFYFGMLILLILLISYFIKVQIDIGENYVDFDSLLGILIFHDIFVFSFYILIALFLIITGIKRIKII